MINVRTWHRIRILGWVMFLLTCVSIPLSKHSPYMGIFQMAWYGFLALCAFGVYHGILAALGRFYVGCPFCNRRCHVSRLAKHAAYLDCEHCGELRWMVGRIGRLRVIRVGSPEDDEMGQVKASGKCRSAAEREKRAVIIGMLPVLVTSITAVLIHAINFFCLLFPSVFCYIVLRIIIKDVMGGRYRLNGELISRRTMPIRFWGNLVFWFFFYLFATAFPVMCALLEKTSETAIP
jgi:hypothetical protein